MNFKDKLKGIQKIIWDWNGTLLDDVDYAISCMNRLLLKRNLPSLNRQKYTEIFSFPVIEYYKKLGFNFDKEPWELVGYEYMKAYWENFYTVETYPEVSKVLNELSKSGIQHSILSAMQQHKLQEHISEHGLLKHFNHIKGINNHYANGKIEAGVELLRTIDSPTKSICLVGDTVHDFDAAQQLRIQCILIANGHVSKSRLNRTGAIVVNDIEQFKALMMSGMIPN